MGQQPARSTASPSSLLVRNGPDDYYVRRPAPTVYITALRRCSTGYQSRYLYVMCMLNISTRVSQAPAGIDSEQVDIFRTTHVIHVAQPSSSDIQDD